MAHRKVAISLPPEVLRQADSLAKKYGLTRSAFLSELVSRAAKEQHDREITETLNRVFGDATTDREHARMTREVYVGEVFGDDSEW